MGNEAVKTIVLAMVLVVLSFLVGAQVSDGIKNSFGAFAVIGMVAIGFLLLLLGKNSWYLVFLLPAVLSHAPIPFLNSEMAVFAVCGGLFAYHIIQCQVMGFSHMKWHSVSGLDIMLLLIFVYMCVSYYRFPVSVNALGVDMDYVGGTVYVYAIGAVVYFLFLSFLDVQRRDLERVLRWAFFVHVAMMAVAIALRLKSGHIYWEGTSGQGELMSDAGQQRITLFSALGFFLLAFAYASRPVLALFRSPLYLGLCLASFGGIALTGARNQLVQSVLYGIGISAIRREISILILMGVVCWAGMLGLDSGGAFENLPQTTQRFIAIVPGVHVSNSVRRETEGSSNVRLIAWRQAFDPKNGYIHDYIWGDGFQLSVKELNRIRTAQMRGTAEKIREDNNTLARTGNWHNGFIYTMHRMGIVGCILFYMVFMIGILMFLRVGSYYRGKPFFPYLCAFTVNCFVFPFVYSYNSRTPVDFFAYFIDLALLKLMYCLLRESGEVSALFLLKRRYVPMTIREIENGPAKTI